MTLVRFNHPVVNRRLASDAYFSNLVDSFMGNKHDVGIVSDLKYEVTEEEKGFVLEVSVPGLGKEDIKLEVDNGVMKISSVEADGDNTRSSLAMKFSKEFKLSKLIDQDSVKAHVENGILSISLPKKEEAVKKPVREISIS